MKNFPLHRIVWLVAALLALASGLAVIAAYIFGMTKYFFGISYALYVVLALISMVYSWKYGYGERYLTVQQRADVLIRVIITLLVSGVMSVVLSAESSITWLAILPGAIVISLSVVLLVLLKRSIFGVTKTS